jgi:voltage-gated potassium channel
MFGMLMLSASVMTIVEGAAQPDKFGTIPGAMWWAMATLSTVGYGDIVPITPLGKIFGGVVTILSIAMYALPIAIIAAGFTNESQRRDFVITWGMVARVPLFAKLDPVSLAKIGGLLRSKSIPAGYEIAHRGEPADSMYFIVSGEVSIDFGGRRFTLEEGDFFGEIALLQETRRRAHARSVTDCRLMQLMKNDFHGLMETEPVLRQEIATVAAERLAQQAAMDGDITEDEMNGKSSRD